VKRSKKILIVKLQSKNTKLWGKNIASELKNIAPKQKGYKTASIFV